jgi:hypothetical protein
VFVPSTDGLYAYEEGCRTDGGVCPPLWHAPTNIEGDISNYVNRPTIAGGRVFVTTSHDAGGGDGQLAAVSGFPMRCRTDGGICPPDWSWRIEPRTMWTGAPLVVDDRVVVATDRGPASFPIACPVVDGSCGKIARAALGGATTSSVAPMLLAGDDREIVGVEPSGSHRGGFALLAGDCSSPTCRPIGWWRPSINVQRIDLVHGTTAFAWTTSRLLGVSIPPDGRPHIVWRWRHPRTAGGSEVVVASGCSAYVGLRRTLYAIGTC